MIPNDPIRFDYQIQKSTPREALIVINELLSRVSRKYNAVEVIAIELKDGVGTVSLAGFHKTPKTKPQKSSIGDFE